MSDFGTDLLENNSEKNISTVSEELDTSNNSKDFSLDNSSEYSNSDIENISNDNKDDDSTQDNNDISYIDNTAPDVNCLYLTVKKDYSLSIFKNKIKRAVKGSWKVAVSVFVLNFLSSFF